MQQDRSHHAQNRLLFDAINSFAYNLTGDLNASVSAPLSQETALKPLSPRRLFFLFSTLTLLALALTACAQLQALDNCPPTCPVPLPNTSIVSPASEEAGKINALYNLVLILATVIFVIVEGLLLFAILRFRNRPPEAAMQVHGNTRLEIAWTTAPAIILAVLLGFTLQTMGEVRAFRSEENVLRVRAIGHQWWWEFRYPGVNPEVITANSLVVPLGATVEVAIETVDVEHGFWAPELFGKEDAVPGYVNRVRFTPTERVDYYSGQCTQFCGIQHAQMRFMVIVLDPADFQTWLAHQQQPAPAATGDTTAVVDLFVTRCQACHTVSGTTAAGVIGPNLTHVATRDFIAGGVLKNTPENMALWLRDPQAVKPGNLMILNPPLTEQEVNDLVAYMSTLK
jgi:cytochrome c oxidase subunit II